MIVLDPKTDLVAYPKGRIQPYYPYCYKPNMKSHDYDEEEVSKIKKPHHIKNKKGWER